MHVAPCYCQCICSSNTFGEFDTITDVASSPFIKNIIKMKGNEISAKELRPDAVEWLRKLHQTMLVKDYGKGSVRNYYQEMRLLFKYYNHKVVADITQADIEQYLQYT
jgi:hypothetical protein